MGADGGYGDPKKPKPKVKVSPNRVKNETIRSGVYKKEKTASGKNFYSTRGTKIRKRAGDRVVTNKKQEQVVVRKSGNRVVVKTDGRVVRRKANGDRVVTKSVRPGQKPPAKPVTGPYVGPRTYQYSPRSTMEGTVTGREGLTSTPPSGYGQGMPKPGKKKVRPTPKPGTKYRDL